MGRKGLGLSDEEMKGRNRERERNWKKENKDRVNQRSRERRLKDPEKHREYYRNWVAGKGDEFREYCRVRNSKWRKNNRVKYTLRQRKSDIKKAYGIELEDVIIMMDSQRGCCAVCGDSLVTPTSKRNYHIDHDHETGLVRGLLCGRCNHIADYAIMFDKEIADYENPLCNRRFKY